MSTRRQASGFTLLEMVIAVAIVGILAAIAVPTYTEYVDRARRGDARRALQETAQELERCYAQYGSYTDDNCAISDDIDGANIDSPDGYYSLTATTLNETDFTLEASPQGVQSDDDCGTFSLQDSGVRDAAEDDCWQ